MAFQVTSTSLGGMNVHTGDMVTFSTLRGRRVEGVVLDTWAVAGGGICLRVRHVDGPPEALVAEKVTVRHCPHSPMTTENVATASP